MFERKRYDESGEKVSFQTWQKKVYKPRLEYSRAQLAELKKNPEPDAKSDTVRLQLHANNMQKIAIRIVAETLQNMSHSMCAKFLQNTERLEQLIYDGTQQAVTCPDIQEFYPRCGLPVVDTHQILSHNICQQILAQWDESYSRKEMPIHDSVRFQKHFLKNLPPLTHSHAVADAFEPKIAAHLEGPPPLVPLEQTIDEGCSPESPWRVIFGQPIDERDLLEPPPLTPLGEFDSPDGQTEDALLDSIQWGEDSLLDNITWQNETSANLPTRPPFVSYDQLASAKDDGPPPLKWFTSEKTAVGESTDDARRKLARQKLRPVADISIATEWLKDAIRKGEIARTKVPLAFFAPTNSTVQTLDSIDEELKPTIIRNVLRSHVCQETAGDKYTSLNNRIIKVASAQIVQPAVKQASLYPTETLKIEGMTIRCYPHDNLLNQ
jgi:hypothetical protein